MAGDTHFATFAVEATGNVFAVADVMGIKT
jgi:hypothetical protein